MPRILIVTGEASGDLHGAHLVKALKELAPALQIVGVGGASMLAAGASLPRDVFRYTVENGADFICVGMYDFQVVEDCNIALDVLNAKLQRQRAWRA